MPRDLCQKDEQFDGTAHILAVALNAGPADLQHIQHPDDVDQHRVLEQDDEMTHDYRNPVEDGLGRETSIMDGVETQRPQPHRP